MDKAKLWAAAGGAVLLLSALAFLGWQNNGLRTESHQLRNELGQMTAVNSAQQSVILRQLQIAAKTNKALLQAGTKTTQLAATNRHLDQQLRRALNNAQEPAVAALPRGVTDYACLRWLSANGRLPHDYLTGNTGSPFAGRDDPVARFCSAWPDLTPQNFVTWSGNLLDQLGTQNIRVRTARIIQKGGDSMGKSH